MIESILQSIEQVLAYLELRSGIWVVLLGVIGGLSGGMAYKKTFIPLVQATTGAEKLSSRCADMHSVLIQIFSGAIAFWIVFELWPYVAGGFVALVTALSCGFIYDVGRALIGIRWPAFAKRLGLPRS